MHGLAVRSALDKKRRSASGKGLVFEKKLYLD